MELIARLVRIITALGNPTGDMSAVTQGDDGSVAALLKNFKAHSRGHVQTRIRLVVPNLAGLGADDQNTAILAELDKIGTVSVLDQTGVDGGEEDWDAYDLVVVGSNIAAAFVLGNIDDLISYHGPIMVCNTAVAAHLLMGVAAAQAIVCGLRQYYEGQPDPPPSSKPANDKPIPRPLREADNAKGGQ